VLRHRNEFVALIARRLMHDNQYACFDIEGTRAAIRARLATADVA
jgi:hypothetical protein